MFEKAMTNNLVAKNPARGIKIAKKDREVEILNHEDQKEFFMCASGTFYNNLFQVAILSGLRMGELCALT